jgi:serine/threonine protein kinase
VDSSKTLVQSRRRRPRLPRGEGGADVAAGQDPDVLPGPNPGEDPHRRGRRSASSAPRAAPPADPPIRVLDERAQRRGEWLFGRYRLIERLGTGGFGTVWHAHDEQLDRAVAVKRIPLASAEERERAMREARATARLTHTAIVALYDTLADEDAFYLISELVEGDTLARLIAAGELYDEDVAEIGLALTHALEHAHANGVIHRDVKPQNVLVPYDAGEETPTRSGASPSPAKLADFGGARLAGDDALTCTGDVFGTLAYMSPEQSEGHEVGPSADLYSLALVLYEAFGGVNPVRGRTPAATAKRIGAPIEPLARLRRDLPRELTRALDVALHPDPDRRGTLAELRDALALALERGFRRRIFARDPPLPRPLTPSPEAQPRRRRVTLPRQAWIGGLLATAVWQAMEGRSGVSLLLLAGGAPLLALPRRSGPGWLAAALAPALGLAGLAGAFPALAGQRAGWRARSALAALGFWWLALAEPLLTRRLWLGPPSPIPSRAAWEASFAAATTHVVGAVLTPELLLGAAVWALAAAILPLIVRGRSAALDAAAALAWTVALLAATPLLERALLAHGGAPSPRGALLGAVLGCALAICARALRGPV